MATTITLSGRLADLTSRPIDPATTTVTVKAPAYTPGPGVELTTTQPAPVAVGEDGEVTLEVVQGVGWLIIDGPGWSDSIRFVAAVGMTRLLEAVINALPASTDMAGLLRLVEEVKIPITEALNDALAQLDAAAANIDGTVPKAEVPVNLFDPTTATFETIAPNGVASPSSVHRLSPFLPVEGGKTYLGWAENLYRVVFFDSEQVAITGTDTEWQDEAADPKLWVAPSNAAWARVVNRARDPQSPVAWFGRSDAVFDPVSPPVHAAQLILG